jgi:hypothetical protein
MGHIMTGIRSSINNGISDAGCLTIMAGLAVFYVSLAALPAAGIAMLNAADPKTFPNPDYSDIPTNAGVAVPFSIMAGVMFGAMNLGASLVIPTKVVDAFNNLSKTTQDHLVFNYILANYFLSTTVAEFIAFQVRNQKDNVEASKRIESGMGYLAMAVPAQLLLNMIRLWAIGAFDLSLCSKKTRPAIATSAENHLPTDSATHREPVDAEPAATHNEATKTPRTPTSHSVLFTENKDNGAQKAEEEHAFVVAH